MLREYIKPIHLVIAFVVLGGLIVVSLLNQAYLSSNPVVLNKVPADAQLFVDGKAITGGRTALDNGTYKIRATREGFYEYTSTAVIDDDTKFIAVSMQPQSDTAKTWVKDNQAAFLAQENFVYAALSKSGTGFLQKNPIVKILPINSSSYDVGYKKDPADSSGQSIIITVNSFGGDRNGAIKSIVDHGFDPADYNIQFSNYTYPFKEIKL